MRCFGGFHWRRVQDAFACLWARFYIDRRGAPGAYDDAKSSWHAQRVRLGDAGIIIRANGFGGMAGPFLVRGDALLMVANYWQREQVCTRSWNAHFVEEVVRASLPFQARGIPEVTQPLRRGLSLCRRPCTGRRIFIGGCSSVLGGLGRGSVFQHCSSRRGRIRGQAGLCH